MMSPGLTACPGDQDEDIAEGRGVGRWRENFRLGQLGEASGLAASMRYMNVSSCPETESDRQVDSPLRWHGHSAADPKAQLLRPRGRCLDVHRAARMAARPR